MQWNLRLVAAHRGIWKAGDLQQLLAEHGLVISAGKMSALWSTTPASLKLSDLDTICTALACEVGDLLVPESVGDTAISGRNHSGRVGIGVRS